MRGGLQISGTLRLERFSAKTLSATGAEDVSLRTSTTLGPSSRIMSGRGLIRSGYGLRRLQR